MAYTRKNNNKHKEHLKTNFYWLQKENSALDETWQEKKRVFPNGKTNYWTYYNNKSKKNQIQSSLFLKQQKKNQKNIGKTQKKHQPRESRLKKERGNPMKNNPKGRKFKFSLRQ